MNAKLRDAAAKPKTSLEPDTTEMTTEVSAKTRKKRGG